MVFSLDFKFPPDNNWYVGTASPYERASIVVNCFNFVLLEGVQQGTGQARGRGLVYPLESWQDAVNPGSELPISWSKRRAGQEWSDGFATRRDASGMICRQQSKKEKGRDAAMANLLICRDAQRQDSSLVFESALSSSSGDSEKTIDL